MSHAVNIHDGTGIIATDPAAGILHCYGTAVPTGPGYAPGCRFIKVDGTSVGGVAYVNIGSKALANFVAAGLTGVICVPFVYGEGTLTDQPFFTAPADRDYVIQSIIARPLVAGTDGGAVTAQIRKANSGTAIASGAAVHSGTIDLKGTINVNQILTLSTTAGVTTVTNRWSLGIDVTGVTTAARGVITVMLLPV